MKHVRKSLTADIKTFIFLWIPYAFFVYRFKWICDDAFISFRYALNLAAGNGLRYNLGDYLPVEGYSNFLWVLICAVFEYFGATITLWPLIVSFACGSILLFLVFITLRHRLQLNLTISCMATLFLGCSSPFIIWSTSGLETVPFALLLFVTFERLIVKPDNAAPVAAGLAGLALAYMRVEGIYWAVFLAIIAIFSRRLASQKYMRALCIYITIILIGYAIYWILRYNYYQMPFSNTIYVKVGITGATLKRGFNYIAVQYLTIINLFVIIPGMVVAIRKSRLSIGLPVVLIPIVTTVYSIVVSGDFMPMGRFLVPCLTFNALLFGWLLKDLSTYLTTPKVFVTMFGIVAILVGILPLFNIHLIPKSDREYFHFRFNTNKYSSEYERWVFGKQSCQNWADKGRALKSYANPSDSIVIKGIGAIGYYSGLYIYDQGGLTNHEVLSAKFDNHQLKSPGHDKMVPVEFFFDKKPTLILPSIVTKSQLLKPIMKQRNSKLAKLYVADFVPIPIKKIQDESKETRYLLVFKRIEEGMDPKTAWSKVDTLLAK